MLLYWFQRSDGSVNSHVASISFFRETVVKEKSFACGDVGGEKEESQGKDSICIHYCQGREE